MEIKKLIIILVVLLTLFPLCAKYSPSLTMTEGADMLIYSGSAYSSLKAALELNPVSWKTGALTLSLPLSLCYVTESLSSDGLLSPPHWKNGIGFEALIDNGKWGGSIAVFYGYEHYREERAIMKYIEARAGFHMLFSPHISLILPLSYTYTSLGDEVSLSLGLRIGGEI